MNDNLIERKAFADFLLGNYSDVYTQENVDHYIEHNHVSWLAWQGRAAIERQIVPAGWMLVPIEPSEAMTDATYAGQHCSDIWRDMIAAAPQPEPVRCTYCDGTGDVHSITGEWRGSCGCEAGKAQPQPVQEPVQEPVATVIKKGSERQWMSERLGRVPDGIYSLYTSPQAQPLSDWAIIDMANKALPGWERKDNDLAYLQVARAIEQAHGITKGTT